MQKTSTYNKIRDILDAASRQSGNLTALAKSIKGRYDSFVYYKRDRDGTVREYPCDESSIRSKIRFCIRLKLIESEENCTLTQNGKNALTAGRFDYQLQQAVIAYIQVRGITVTKIDSAINKLLLPHVSALYQYLAPDMSEDMFRTCLFLLSECGKDKGENILNSFDKKLYLSESKIAKQQEIMEKKKQ